MEHTNGTRIARIQISFSLLRQLLQLPENVSIVEVANGDGTTKFLRPEFCQVRIESKDNEQIPFVHFGEEIPLVDVIVHSKTVVDRVEFKP